jgi:hypothetical protein
MSNAELEELGKYGWEVLSLSPFRMIRDAQFAGGFHYLESEEEAREEIQAMRDHVADKEKFDEALKIIIKKRRKDNPRDPERIEEVLYKLGELWKKVPDWRLCQLLDNLKQNVKPDSAVFYLEDYDLVEQIDKQLEYENGNRS